MWDIMGYTSYNECIWMPKVQLDLTTRSPISPNNDHQNNLVSWSLPFLGPHSRTALNFHPATEPGELANGRAIVPGHPNVIRRLGLAKDLEMKMDEVLDPITLVNVKIAGIRMMWLGNMLGQRLDTLPKKKSRVKSGSHQSVTSTCQSPYKSYIKTW